MKVRVFTRDDFKRIAEMSKSPLWVFRGIRTRMSQTGPEVLFYAQFLARDNVVVEYEEVVQKAGEELGEEEYQKRLEDFNKFLSEIPDAIFFEGVIE